MFCLFSYRGLWTVCRTIVVMICFWFQMLTLRYSKITDFLVLVVLMNGRKHVETEWQTYKNNAFIYHLQFMAVHKIRNISYIIARKRLQKGKTFRTGGYKIRSFYWFTDLIRSNGNNKKNRFDVYSRSFYPLFW